MKDFMDYYSELDFPYRNLIRGFLEKLNEGKEIEPKGFFAMNLETYKKQFHLSTGKIAKKIQEKYNDTTDVANTLRRSLNRHSKKSVHSKAIAEIMGITENELVYGIEDKVVVNRIPVISISNLYDALGKKYREAVLDLTKNLWILQYVPEAWEDSEYSEAEKVLDELENSDFLEDSDELDNPDFCEDLNNLENIKDMNEKDNVVQNLTKVWWDLYEPTDSEFEETKQ